MISREGYWDQKSLRLRGIEMEIERTERQLTHLYAMIDDLRRETYEEYVGEAKADAQRAREER